jgi:hypothetical protein
LAGPLAGSPQRDQIREQFERRGFAYWRCDATVGLPDYYRASWHTPAYVRQHWSKWFEVVSYLEDWARIEEQDMVVLRR